MALRRGLYVRKDGNGLGASPADARLAHPAAYRQGVFYTHPDASAVSGTSGWAYRVGAAQYAVSDGAGGFYLFANDGPADTPTVTAAPASGSRWDLIYVLPQDPDVSGTSSLPVFGVTQGTAGGTPTKPYGSVPAGALVLAEAQVVAGATSTSHANVTITPVFPWTASLGAPIPVRSTAERNGLVTMPGLRARRLDTGSTEEFNAGAWGLPFDIAAITPGPLRVLFKNTSQTFVTDQYSTVGWATTTGDKGDGSGLVYSNGALTVQRAGLYSVKFRVTFEQNATGSRAMRVTLNGSEIEVNNQPARSDSRTTLALATDIQCDVGQVLSFEVYQNSGGNLPLRPTGSMNRLVVRWVRP